MPRIAGKILKGVVLTFSALSLIGWSIELGSRFLSKSHSESIPTIREGCDWKAEGVLSANTLIPKSKANGEPCGILGTQLQPEAGFGNANKFDTVYVVTVGTRQATFSRESDAVTWLADQPMPEAARK
jgi:hypothetical protein